LRDGGGLSSSSTDLGGLTTLLGFRRLGINSFRVSTLGLHGIILQSSNRGSHPDSTSLVHSHFGSGVEVLANVGLHLGIVLPGEGAVRLDDIGAVLLGEGDFTVIPECGTSAVDPYWQVISTSTGRVGAPRRLIQWEPIHRPVGLPETPVGLGVRSLGHKEDFLHPGGTPVSSVRDLPAIAEACLNT